MSSNQQVPFNPLAPALTGAASVAATPTRKNQHTAVATAVAHAVAPAKPSKGKSLNACKTTGSEEWYTPKPIVDALGPFDLDPCAPMPGDRPYTIASTVFTKVDNGLAQTWQVDHFVWCNPPYGDVGGEFMDKLAAHPAGGIALVFVRTDTRWAQRALAQSSAVLYLAGRISFWDKTGKPGAGTAGAPSMLLAFGDEAVRRLEKALIAGNLKGQLMKSYKPRVAEAVAPMGTVSANDGAKVAA